MRDICVFARQNVTKDPPFSKLDLITCRNLLIYLGPVLQSRVMRLFHYALRPDGYLVLGRFGAHWQLGRPILRTLRQTTPHLRAQDCTAHGVGFRQLRLKSRGTNPRARAPRQRAGFPGRVDRMILARYSPPAVVLNRALKILQFRGDTTPFLEHSSGEASLDLVKLSRAGLGPEIRRMVDKAEATLGPVRVAADYPRP